MATPHPGKWELVLNQSKCELNTLDNAIQRSSLHLHLQSNQRAVECRWTSRASPSNG